MAADLYPLQVLLVTLAGWVNRHQQHVIEYLVEENRVHSNFRLHRLSECALSDEAQTVVLALNGLFR
jgi:hypothetical protein